MAKKFLVPIDLNKNEILNVVIQNLASNPTQPLEGQVFLNTTSKDFLIHINSSWQAILTELKVSENPAASKIVKSDVNGKISKDWLSLGSGNGIDSDLLDGSHGSYYLDRTNHTGTQLASTISDFNSAVRLNRLDQLALPVQTISLNGQIITNSGTPTNDSDLATVQYVKNYISLNDQGIRPKGSVRIGTTTNIVLSGLQTLQSITLNADDLVLVKHQTNSFENGIYRVKSGSWTRDDLLNTWSELYSAYVFVSDGDLANTSWVCTIPSSGTLETDPITWSMFFNAGSFSISNVGTGTIQVYKQKNGSVYEFNTIDPSTTVDATITNNVIKFSVKESGLNINSIGGNLDTFKTTLNMPKKFVQSFGNGTLTQFNINHNLNTLDIIAQVRYSANSLDYVDCDIKIIDVNNLQLNFSVAPSSNEFRIIVIG